MRRRTLLGLGVVDLGGGAYHYRDQIDMAELASNLSIEKSLNGDLDRMEWSENEATLTVWFEEEHGSDFLALIHGADEKTVLWKNDAPRFDGPLTVPMLDAIACDAPANYPSSTFELVAGIGTTTLGMVQEITARQPVDVSDSWLKRAEEHNVGQRTCIGMTFN